ncbi:cytidylate kinase [Tanacetum coccineum]
MCMVGSAAWFSKDGKSLKLDAVLKLNFARFMTLETSLVSGILKSLAEPHDSNYFDPISMMGFPRVAPFKYNYTLVSNQECVSSTLEDSVTSIQSLRICSIFMRRFITYKLEYPTSCKNCSLFGQDSDYLPTFVSLYAIQCESENKKLRFLIEFQDRRFTPYDQSFNPSITLIGEGTWNGTKDVLCITACHILNQSDRLGSARVGDCSIRLTLWFPAVRSIMKAHTTEGQIWSTKLTDEMGSFRAAKVQSFGHSQQNYGWKYEYTLLEKVKQVCPKKKRVGDKYRLGYYAFDMSVKHKNLDSTGSASPIFVVDPSYNRYRIVNPDFSPWKAAAAPVAASSVTSYNGRQNISFEISFRLNFSSTSSSGISSLSLSVTDNSRVEISAEGFYDDETGDICMVGCRNINSNNVSFDCELVVKFHLPQGNGSFLKGSIESLREKRDVLYFEHLDIFSLSYTKTEARKMIWRIDLEIIMVLISDTLVCLFVGQQLFHLKKSPEMISSISVFTMLILTFGYMVPLVLNFEAIFSNTKSQQYIQLGTNGGWVEMNEVVVRIVTMVAFILQFRLLQLTWIAKQNHWIHEIWTLVIYIPMYIIGGFAMLVLNRNNNNSTITLRSYAGLTLDGFLFPQLIHNILQNSIGNALCYLFYVGTTFVRLVPHVYDLYRDPKNISHQFDRLYIYANPRADFYSPSWDIVIVCGGVVLAVIIFLQQSFGGRFVFPKRFRETVEYEMVPVTSNE